MSKRNYGGFSGDEPFEDGENRDMDNGSMQSDGRPPTLIKLMKKMYGHDVGADDIFDAPNEADSSTDGQYENYKRQERQRQRQQQQQQKKHKTDDDDDDDDDDPRDHEHGGVGEEDEESRKDSNIGGNTKKDQEARFFGFKGIQFVKLGEMNGENIEEDATEKDYIESMIKKCNSTIQKERDEARKIVMSRKFVHPQVKKNFCKVCEFVDSNLFSLQRFADTEFAPSQITRQYDLATCGHKDEMQLFQEMTSLYNAYKVKSAGTAGTIDFLFRVDEVARCFRRHNKMNLKRVLVNAIHTAQVLKEEALMHVKGEARTGQKIFQAGVGKFVMDMVEKEVNYTARLIQADMMIHESGVLTSHKGGPISNRGMITGMSKSNYKKGADALKGSFYNKTAPTGKYASHTM